MPLGAPDLINAIEGVSVGTMTGDAYFDDTPGVVEGTAIEGTAIDVTELHNERRRPGHPASRLLEAEAASVDASVEEMSRDEFRAWLKAQTPAIPEDRLPMLLGLTRDDAEDSFRRHWIEPGVAMGLKMDQTIAVARNVIAVMWPIIMERYRGGSKTAYGDTRQEFDPFSWLEKRATQEPEERYQRRMRVMPLRPRWEPHKVKAGAWKKKPRWVNTGNPAGCGERPSLLSSLMKSGSGLFEKGRMTTYRMQSPVSARTGRATRCPRAAPLERRHKLEGGAIGDYDIPLSLKREPNAVVIFTLRGTRISVECSSQYSYQQNLRACYYAIEAMRMNEKRGIADTIRKAYLQLDAPPEERDPYEVMGLRPDADLELVTDVYKMLSKKRHPDLGGSAKAMQELNDAYARIKLEREGANGRTS